MPSRLPARPAEDGGAGHDGAATDDDDNGDADGDGAADGNQGNADGNGNADNINDEERRRRERGYPVDAIITEQCHVCQSDTIDNHGILRITNDTGVCQLCELDLRSIGIEEEVDVSDVDAWE